MQLVRKVIETSTGLCGPATTRLLISNYFSQPMQYQVDPTDQTPENGQKPLFWPFGSFKTHFCDL